MDNHFVNNSSTENYEKTIERKNLNVYREPLAILIALSLPSEKTAAALAERLQLKKEHIEKILNQLKEIGLTETYGHEWQATETTIHLPKTSRFNSLNHSNWRQKAVQNSFLQTEDV